MRLQCLIYLSRVAIELQAIQAERHNSNVQRWQAGSPSLLGPYPEKLGTPMQPVIDAPGKAYDISVSAVSLDSASVSSTLIPLSALRCAIQPRPRGDASATQ